jgi:predicted amidohydrolase
MSEFPATLRIGLATVPNAPTVEERLDTLDRMLAEAAEQQVAIVCFPETYIPGLRGFDFYVPPMDQTRQEAALERIRRSAAEHGVAAIVGIEWESELGAHNAAVVVNRDGTVQGFQTKNQLPLEEAPYYVTDGKRRLFEIDGVPFGITICHEGWRYPEATRWAAARGAKIVFHPQLTGSDSSGPTLTRWGAPENPYYEKAMLMRSIENTIYFASVNYAFAYPESASSVIGPEGDLLTYFPYGEAGLLVYDVGLDAATRLIASRYDAGLYPE